MGVKCVVWCVKPGCRRDAVLQEQANYIHRFITDEEKAGGKIWSNVPIVCKGKDNDKLAVDVRGATSAARKIYTDAKPRTIRYGLASERDIKETSESYRKECSRKLTPEEIRSELEEEFSQLPPPVTVVFGNKRCRACGQTGDPRLMEDKCHRNKIRDHTGTLKQRFSKPIVAGSLGLGAAGSVALGVTAVVLTEGLVMV